MIQIAINHLVKIAKKSKSPREPVNGKKRLSHGLNSNITRHSYHKGEGGGSAKVSHDIFSKKTIAFCFVFALKPALKYSFLINLNVTSHRVSSPKATLGGG
jgi:hypothetical protein